MAVIRINKDKNYTVMSKYHLQDKSISLKAKGLLSVMLSLSDDWVYSVAGLAAISVENETAIKSALNELKKAGYVVVTKLTPKETKSGRFEYVYDIFERPEKQGIEKQGVEFLPLEFLDLENLPLYKYTNNKITNNKITNNKITNISSTNDIEITQSAEADAKPPQKHKYGEYGNVLLADDELEKLKSEYPNDWENRINRLSEYIASTGKKYKSHLATIRAWARKETEQTQIKYQSSYQRQTPQQAVYQKLQEIYNEVENDETRNG